MNLVTGIYCFLRSFFSLFLALFGAIFMVALEGEICAGLSVNAIFQSHAVLCELNRDEQIVLLLQ